MTLRYRLHLLRPRYMKIRAMRVVCLVRGHRWGDIATRMLGVCDRCHFPYDPPTPTEGSDPYDRAAKALLDNIAANADLPTIPLPPLPSEKPCAGKGPNVCNAEGCFGEACIRAEVAE